MIRRRPKARPWRVQWHIVADGRVIQQLPKGPEAHLSQFYEHATTRRVRMDDLKAMQRSHDRADRLEWLWQIPLFAVFGGMIVGAVGGLIANILGSPVAVWLWLFYLVLGPALVLLIIGVSTWLMLRGPGSRSRVGLADGGDTMSSSVARRLIAEPTTQSSALFPESRS